MSVIGMALALWLQVEVTEPTDLKMAPMPSNIVYDERMGNFAGTWKIDADSAQGTMQAKIIARQKDKFEFVLTFDNLPAAVSLPTEVRFQIVGERSPIGLTFTTSAHSGEWKLIFQNGTYEGTFRKPEQLLQFNFQRQQYRSPTFSSSPVVLFDGQTLDGWQSLNGQPARWEVLDGTMRVKPGTGNIVSKQQFQDAFIHLEFRTPFEPDRSGQARGNSGIYVQGRYEIQVLDSFGLPPRDNEAGGIYQASVPKTNAALPPGEWQTYDILFFAPRFDDAKMITPAIITVYYNGTLIHEQVQLKQPTPGNVNGNMKEPGGIMLQDHGNLLEFRNIWFVPLNTSQSKQ